MRSSKLRGEFTQEDPTRSHNGNLSGYTDPCGLVAYTYDQTNRLTELLEPAATTPVRFGYDDANRRTTTYPTTPTATVITAGYDNAANGGATDLADLLGKARRRRRDLGPR